MQRQEGIQTVECSPAGPRAKFHMYPEWERKDISPSGGEAPRRNARWNKGR